MNSGEGELVIEEAACPLCVSLPAGHDKHVLVGRDLLHDVPGSFSVVKCNGCGLMRTNPRPSTRTIGVFYPDHYGPYLSTRVQQASVNPGWVRRLVRVLTCRMFKFNTDTLPPMKPGRLLEVGCASGSFLHRMADDAWRVEGIEFSPSAARIASNLGHTVHVGTLESAPVPDEPFDLIVGWMVLEHLHDPIGGLRKLRACARPDTWLVLSVPNAASLEFRVFKQRWYALQVPTHLYHFTPATLRHVLGEAGWKLHSVHHQRVLANLIGSTGYVLRDAGFQVIGDKLIQFPDRPGRWNHILFPVAWILSLFGQTGRMTVWAKPD